MLPEIVAELAKEYQGRARRLGRAVFQPFRLMLTAVGAFVYRVLWSLLFALAGVTKPRRAGQHGRRR